MKLHIFLNGLVHEMMKSKLRMIEFEQQNQQKNSSVWIRKAMILIRTNFMNRSLISSTILRANFFQSMFKIFFRTRISIDLFVNLSFMIFVICRKHQLNSRFFVNEISCLITSKFRFWKYWYVWSLIFRRIVVKISFVLKTMIQVFLITSLINKGKG